MKNELYKENIAKAKQALAAWADNVNTFNTVFNTDDYVVVFDYNKLLIYRKSDEIGLLNTLANISMAHVKRLVEPFYINDGLSEDNIWEAFNQINKLINK